MASRLERSISGFNEGSIRVVVFGNKRHQIIVCPVKENKAFLTKKVSIGFTTDDVGQVKVRSRRPPFRVEWFNAILWRQGAAKAIPWGNKNDELPPLTMQENQTLIERLTAAAKARDKKPIGDWQFAVLLVMVGLVLVGVALNLFGVHFSASQVHQIVTATATPHPTPTPIRVG